MPPEKVLLLLAWPFSFTLVAITEVFLGQLFIALLVALIGATPPTVAIVLMARKQSAERQDAKALLLAGQKEMHQALDGKLSELVLAKEAVSHAAGVQQERVEERARVAVADASPQQVEVVNSPDSPVPTIPVRDELK